MNQFDFPRADRIRSQQDFADVYSARQRAGDKNLLIFAITNQLERCRLGVSVSKKNGNAIMRARKKRMIREAFRLVQHQLPKGLDLIVIPRPEVEANLKQYQHSLKQLTQKLYRRLEHKQSG